MEPTYHYIKGQGWVPTNGPQEWFFESQGRHYKIVDRLPQIGERGMWVYGVPRTPEKIREWIARLKASNLHGWECVYVPGYPGCAVTIVEL